MLVKDQMGRELRLPKTLTRIVSLVPSQTELLVDLGLEDNIIGVTKFCVHPKHLRMSKKVVGGTKNISLEKIPFVILVAATGAIVLQNIFLPSPSLAMVLLNPPPPMDKVGSLASTG